MLRIFTLTIFGYTNNIMQIIRYLSDHYFKRFVTFFRLNLMKGTGRYCNICVPKILFIKCMCCYA